MAASGAKSGFGTTLAIEGTAITELLDITGPNQSRTMIDVTNMGSDNNAREYLAGLIEGGNITCRLSVIAAKLTYIVGLADDTATSTAVITLPSSLGTCTVEVWVQEFTPRAVIDDKVELDLNLKCTGKPVWS